VHTSVGAARAMHAGVLPGEALYGCFQRALNRWENRLQLEARVAGTLVLKDHCDSSRHRRAYTSSKSAMGAESPLRGMSLTMRV